MMVKAKAKVIPNSNHTTLSEMELSQFTEGEV